MVALLLRRGERRLDRLAKRAKTGDSRAFSALYRESYPLVMRYLRRRVADQAMSEDLCAKTFERVVAKLETYDAQRGSFEAWTVRIARNALIDHLRARRPEAGESALQALVEQGPDPLARVLENERLSQLGELLKGCKAQDRKLLAMRYGDGLAHRDIAALLEISEAAVRKRLSRAVAELRERSRQAALARSTQHRGKEVGYVY